MNQYPYFNNILSDTSRGDPDRASIVIAAFMRLIEDDPSRQLELYDLYSMLPMVVRDGIRNCISANDYDYQYIVARHRIDRDLAVTRRHSTLRSIENSYSHLDDWDDIVQHLADTYDVITCQNCDHLEFSDEMHTSWEDDEFCRGCADDGAYRWSDSYEQFVREDNARWALDEDGDEILISSQDDDFHYNEDLDRWTHVNYEHEPEIIGRYHSSKGMVRKQPSPWTALKKRYIGVELEVEVKRISGRDRQKKAEQLHELLNDDQIGKQVFFENDGSLNDGFEIITQPMGLDKHKELWSWLNDKSATRGLLSHNTSTCGLHVHISKDGMTKLQIAKIVSFINDPDNEGLIRAVARRYAEGYCRIKQKKIGSAANSDDRYEAVNITGRNTIEFRIFKGSLKYESVLAAIQFSNALVDFCGRAQVSIQDLKADKFIEWINEHESEDTEVLRPYIEQRLELA